MIREFVKYPLDYCIYVCTCVCVYIYISVGGLVRMTRGECGSLSRGFTLSIVAADPCKEWTPLMGIGGSVNRAALSLLTLRQFQNQHIFYLYVWTFLKDFHFSYFNKNKRNLTIDNVRNGGCAGNIKVWTIPF